jgi:hypothetical protein
VTNRLMLINRYSKGFTFARIFDAFFKGATLQTNRRRRDARTGVG